MLDVASVEACECEVKCLQSFERKPQDFYDLYVIRSNHIAQLNELHLLKSERAESVVIL